jgi:hypothetical protein
MVLFAAFLTFCGNHWRVHRRPTVIAVLTIRTVTIPSRWVGALRSPPYGTDEPAGALMTPISTRETATSRMTPQHQAAIAVVVDGSLLAEISLPKLAIVWMLLIGFPGLLLSGAALL